MIKMLLVKFHYLKIKYSKSIEKIKDYLPLSVAINASGVLQMES